MVRLKVGDKTAGNESVSMFQFQYGAIKSREIRQILLLYINDLSEINLYFFL